MGLIKMTNEIIYNFDGDGGYKNSELERISDLGEGSLGDVYRVRNIKDKSRETLACKILQAVYRGEDSQKIAQEFISNAQECRRERYHHLTSIKSIGTVDIDGNDVPAMLMDYCGSNLLKVRALTSKVKNLNENAYDAFNYKVVLTVLEGLKELHYGKEKSYHGDIKPSNILSGIDAIEIGKLLKDNPEKALNLLEENLINSDVKICDRTVQDEIGSLTRLRSSVLANLENDQQLAHFGIVVSDDKGNIDYKATDVKNLLRTYSILSGKSLELLHYFVNDKLGINMIGPDKEIIPKINVIKKKLIKKIESEGYFKVDIDEKEGKVRVLRPVDIFLQEWGGKTITGCDDLQRFFEGDKDSSYLQMDIKSKNNIRKADLSETEKLDGIFYDVLNRSLKSIDSSLEESVADNEKLSRSLEKLNKLLINSESELEKNKKGLTNLTEVFNRGEIDFENYSSNNSKIAKRISVLPGEIKNHQEQIKIATRKKKVNSSKLIDDLNFIIYVNDSIIGNISDSRVKTEVEGYVNKRTQLVDAFGKKFKNEIRTAGKST